MKQKAECMRDKFKKGELVVGGHAFLTDPCITELFGYHGFEFVWIDAEHGAFTLPCIQSHIQAAASAGTASIVRIAWNDPVLAKPILEMGPDGIIFPYIRSVEEAKKAMAACLYPPKGIRGFGPRRANQYGVVEDGKYLDNVERSFLRIIQVEHRDAVECLEDILRVDGLDLVVTGPCDLSASYGMIGQTHALEMENVYDQIAGKCKKMGKPFGVSLGPSDEIGIKNWIERGAVFLGCADDMNYMRMGSRKTLSMVRNYVEFMKGRNWTGKWKEDRSGNK